MDQRRASDRKLRFPTFLTDDHWESRFSISMSWATPQTTRDGTVLGGPGSTSKDNRLPHTGTIKPSFRPGGRFFGALHCKLKICDLTWEVARSARTNKSGLESTTTAPLRLGAELLDDDPAAAPAVERPRMRNDGRGRSQSFLRPISIASLARRRHAAQVPIQDPRVRARLLMERVGQDPTQRSELRPPTAPRGETRCD